MFPAGMDSRFKLRNVLFMFKEWASQFDTPIGSCGLAWSEAGLTGVQLPEATPEQTAARLTRHGAQLVDEGDAPPHVAAVMAALREFLAGKPTCFGDVTLDMSRHSAFERAAYEALRKVSWGQTITYGDLARSLGQSGAARAIGMAMGRNSWPLIVPCHRVLGANGWLGGFSAPGGAVTKKALLEREGVYPDGGQMALFE